MNPIGGMHRWPAISSSLALPLGERDGRLVGPHASFFHTGKERCSELLLDRCYRKGARLGPMMSLRTLRFVP